MKAIIDGVPIEGTPTELAEFIRSWQNEAPGAHDPACLTPSESEAYDRLLAHKDGAHYKVIADELGITEAAANSRCQALLSQGMAIRVHTGIYKVVES